MCKKTNSAIELSYSFRGNFERPIILWHKEIFLSKLHISSYLMAKNNGISLRHVVKK